ncbi:NAD(P)H-hydrate dehydratase [Acinetobacter puyangensis]|uniref:NAD(P)H-hydrate dehydratase n=1 Tax=Acinetobacter puyangensis TaxID=1096779 RepID=UPI003A4D8FB2
MKALFGCHPVYHSQSVQAWEKRWFAANNCSYGLMQQAALAMTLQIEKTLYQKQLVHQEILVWCGQGNNAGDGYLIAKYLKQKGLHLTIYAPQAAMSQDAQRARDEAIAAGIHIYSQLPLDKNYNIHVDALFGVGLNRPLDQFSQQIITQLNTQPGFKIAIDIPSGLHPNTGVPLPIAIKADLTLSVMALKLGLVIGQAQNYVGELIELPLIPADEQLKPSAYINYNKPVLAKRQATQHKGSFGHVLVIGGHPNMGGAVMMAGEAAMASGAGKVTVMCDARHHTAIVARSPNIMLKDIAQTDVAGLSKFLAQIDVVCFGMGLGRDAWSETNFHMVVNALKQQSHIHTVIFDADALWFLAQYQHDIQLQAQWIATPHSGEAARLLACNVAEVEQDRVAAIEQLQQQYAGKWLLKGAGSLTLEQDSLGDLHLDICAFGNAGMGTAGMGDVLSGMMAGLKAQFKDEISLAEIVALHALAGDELAKQGMRGIQAQHMVDAIYQVVNLD